MWNLRWAHPQASGEWQNLTTALAELPLDLGWELDFLCVQTHLRPVPDMAPALVLAAPLLPLSLGPVWPPPRRQRATAGNRVRSGEQRRPSGRGRGDGGGNSARSRGDGPSAALGELANESADDDVVAGALADAYDHPGTDAAESEEDGGLEEAPLDGDGVDDDAGGGVGELRFADDGGVGDEPLEADATDEEMSGDGEPGLHPDTISDGLPEPVGEDADESETATAEPFVSTSNAACPPREAGARGARASSSSEGANPPPLPPRPESPREWQSHRGPGTSKPLAPTRPRMGDAG